MSLTDLYNNITGKNSDLESMAEAEAVEIVKQASDETDNDAAVREQALEYINAGRIMAQMDASRMNADTSTTESDTSTSIKDTILQEMISNPEYAQSLSEKHSA